MPLPTGVVTFLLTDIEGSTRLWEREPEAMGKALARHDAIVTACVRRQNGSVVKSKGEGDSVFAVFHHARDAVNAALIVQIALGMEQWPTSKPISVRMAIHTGQVDLRDGDYYGPTVNRCARLRALAKGGQVLISGVTAQLVRNQLPSGAGLSDLGTHQLKDLAAPERVWLFTHAQMRAAVVAEAEPVAPTRTAYLLTDHTNRTADGLEWGAGVAHSTSELGGGERFRCYSTPKLAALFNPLHDRVRLPRLWEVVADHEIAPGEGIVESDQVRGVRQVPLPPANPVDYARFSVLCAQAAFAVGTDAVEFSQWAESWLAGLDNSGVAARAMADAMESASDRGSGVAQHEELMAANAARAALHAARTAWMVGRARDEEIARCAELAAEAVGLALHRTHLDLPEVAERALQGSSAPALSLR
ncbi:MAG TPA: adenylate/guanylate cyclase domain-containing protein [Chloroflexota bacterium]